MKPEKSSQGLAIRVLLGAFILALAGIALYFSFLTGTYAISILTIIFLIVSGLLLTTVFKFSPLTEALHRDSTSED